MRYSLSYDSLWDALKASSKKERNAVSYEQAKKRVKSLALDVGLQEEALDFYAREYVDMVSRR